MERMFDSVEIVNEKEKNEKKKKSGSSRFVLDSSTPAVSGSRENGTRAEVHAHG
jgi:hypothetical protein